MRKGDKYERKRERRGGGQIERATRCLGQRTEMKRGTATGRQRETE